ncbi:nicotinate phosphoribosyltransferase [Endozoicomonas sp. Mp262]|uniref:nicotinate phosphoribosyltransferase n=1 Tax=Endozoicomonas sp. Mp262 TaxID=2919499 RepID=UPI0021D84408
MQDPIIQSLLDTDLYKYTMQQSMVRRYPGATAKMAFRSRGHLPINLSLVELRREIECLGELRLSDQELNWLAGLPYISGQFLDYLTTFRLDPGAVMLAFRGGQLDIEINGNWASITHFEIFLLSIISELHCRNTYGLDGEYDVEQQGRDRLEQKLLCLNSLKSRSGFEGFQFVDFGTRRRYSRVWQEHVVRQFQARASEFFAGTSNLDLARRLGLMPVGTMAHEWLQSHQVLGQSLLSSQKDALKVWLQEYQGQLGIALTDTISMNAFLRDFNGELARAYAGVRHDSGDPVAWGEQALAHYRALGIDARDKMLVFSDKLDLQRAIEIYSHFKGRINVSFGIGTYLTNDMGYQAPNIVLKLVEVNGLPVAKLSDSPGKTMCQDADFISRLKTTFQYRQAS